MSISLSVASMYSLLSASCLLAAWLATSGSSTPHFRSLLCEVNTMKSLNTADRLYRIYHLKYKDLFNAT